MCKKGVYPYTYVDQPDASLISKNMYNSEYFESDLINSYAWDTALIFIQIFSGDSNYSLQKGENTENSLQKLGENILKNVDNNDESQDIRCNIYDIAGNAYEWTTEMHTLNNYPCFSRGGCYSSNATPQASTRLRGTGNNYSATSCSFRVILYL